MICEIKTFYSKEITAIFISIYGSISFLILSFNVFYFYLFSGVSREMIMFMSIGGFAGGFPILQRYQPTRITIKHHDLFYTAKNVERVIDEFSIIFYNERKIYGFIWGYERKEISADKIMFFPLANPKYPNGIFGKEIRGLLLKLTKYGGLTSAVEVSTDGEDIFIYGPYFTLKKFMMIYAEFYLGVGFA